MISSLSEPLLDVICVAKLIPTLQTYLLKLLAVSVSLILFLEKLFILLLLFVLFIVFHIFWVSYLMKLN